RLVRVTIFVAIGVVGRDRHRRFLGGRVHSKLEGFAGSFAIDSIGESHAIADSWIEGLGVCLWQFAKDSATGQGGTHLTEKAAAAGASFCVVVRQRRFRGVAIGSIHNGSRCDKKRALPV